MAVLNAIYLIIGSILGSIFLVHFTKFFHNWKDGREGRRLYYALVNEINEHGVVQAGHLSYLTKYDYCFQVGRVMFKLNPVKTQLTQSSGITRYEQMWPIDHQALEMVVSDYHGYKLVRAFDSVSILNCQFGPYVGIPDEYVQKLVRLLKNHCDFSATMPGVQEKSLPVLEDPNAIHWELRRWPAEPFWVYSDSEILSGEYNPKFLTSWQVNLLHELHNKMAPEIAKVYNNPG